MLPQKYYYIKIGSSQDLVIPKERLIYRILETIPGILALTTLVGVFLISWQAPIFAAFFIITFDIYWLLKTVYLSLHLRSAFKKVKENLKINWLKKCQTSNVNWQDIYHLIIMPFYNENFETICASIESLINANYPKNKMIVILGVEERMGKSAIEIAKKINNLFGDKFFKFLITVHPKDLPNEIPGKGSNIAWAGKEAKEKIIDALKISYENVIVSAFDIDTVIYSDYLGRLTYVYLNAENRQNFSYQPVPFYINNIWPAPALSRVVAFSATFWHTLQQERIEHLTTFSSHSMPFQALVNVGFWQKNMVSEDSRIFWQCLLKNNGDYGVIPLYFPVKMDANAAPTFWQTMKNLYKQQRRWAWGCENIPYMFFGFWKNKKIPLRKKWHYSWIYLEGFWSWSTNAIIIFFLGWLPIILGGEAFRQTLLAYNLPQITRWIMSLAMIGIVTAAYLTIFILPPQPKGYGKHKYLMMIFQWPLLLITMIVFGSIPALESQTRLMLGKKFRLGFWVTPK